MEDIDNNKTVTHTGNPDARNQQQTFDYREQQEPMMVEPKIVVQEPNETQRYLFIYYIEASVNQLEIVDVFETNATNFKFGSTFYDKSKTSEYNMRNQNHIAVEKNSFFKSKFTMNDNKWNVAEEFKTMQNFEIITPLHIVNATGVIVFCAYDTNNQLVNSYYTKGTIFYYENGIGSSQEIQEFADTMDVMNSTISNQSIFDDNRMSGGIGNVLDKNRDFGNRYGNVGPTFSKTERFKTPTEKPFEATKKAPLNTGLTKKPNVTAPTPTKIVSSPTPAPAKIVSSPTTVRRIVSANTFDANRAYSTIYINSLNPNDLQQILGTVDPMIIFDIIKYLYIDISIKNQECEKYNFLYMCIHDFYYSLKDDNGYTELKKEIKYYKGLKINKYIEKHNEINNLKKYCNESFVIHKNDFVKFKKYVSKKFDDLKKTFQSNAFTMDSFSKFLENFKEVNINRETEAIIPKIKSFLESINNGINTYLKITNFEEGNQNSAFEVANNKRYTVKVLEGGKMVEMQYASENKPFYKINDDKTITQNPKVDFNQINYDSKFMFGPFNHIFEQKILPENIVTDKTVEPLMKQIKEGKPVFILGYGASGSGKTSSLVYFSKTNKPGILIYLCNKLASDNYKNIEIKCMEFFKPYDENHKYTPIGDGAVYTESESFEFNYNNNSFLLAKPVNYTINHPYKLEQQNQNQKQNQKQFNAGKSLEEIIFYLIESDRLIKATPNNPNSSRSHVLCFLKLKTDDGKEANIIFGDLAGVENKFKCKDVNDINDIKKLFNKKRDTPIDPADVNEKFYKKEIKKDNRGNTIIDPYKGGASLELTTDEANKFPTIFDKPYFTFDEPSIINMFKETNISSFLPKDEKLINRSILKFVEMILVHIKILQATEIKDERQDKTSEMSQTLFKGLKTLNEQIIQNTFDEKNLEIPINIGIIKMNEQTNAKNNPLVILLYQAIRGWEFGRNTFRQNNSNTNKNAWTQEEITKLNGLLKSGLIDIFYTKIKECILANKIMNNVCEHRVIEGSFINTSLQQLTDDFLNIINHKNKDNVYYVPNFAKECLQSYCSDSYSFSIKADDDKNSKPKSIMIQKISEYLKNGEDYQKFYNDLEIYVFCFFNWSRSANNPPPVPYVDINNLKKMLYLSDSESFDIVNFNDILRERIDKATEIAGKNAATDNVVLELRKLQRHIAKINGSDVYDDFYKFANEIFENIDNVNAATAIGTIEFLDKIAKLNTIKNSCQM